MAKGKIMTVEQLLKMDPDATMAWMQENRAAFELVPVTPSDEMIKAAAGPDFSQEDRESRHIATTIPSWLKSEEKIMFHSVDLLARSGNLTPLEKAILDKASSVRALRADGLLTSLEASHQIWAIKDILIAIDPNSLMIEPLRDLEKQIVSASPAQPVAK